MKTLLSALSLLPLPLAFTQTLPPNQGVTIKPLWAQQGPDVMNPSAVGHPVITGSGMSGDALLKQFTVTNYSSKPVQSIEYGWRIAAPTACCNSTLPLRWETASANVNIAPGGEATIAASESLSKSGSSKALANEASTNQAPVVLVTIGLLKVTYADGSTWTDEEALKHNTFDGNLYDKHEGCHSPTVSELQKKRS